MKPPVLLKIVSALVLTGLSACGESAPAKADAAGQENYEPGETREALARAPTPITVETPEMNPRRGRIQFITRGCVICHQVNGVGGKAAPDLSASTMQQAVNPLDFPPGCGGARRP